MQHVIFHVIFFIWLLETKLNIFWNLKITNLNANTVVSTRIPPISFVSQAQYICIADNKHIACERTKDKPTTEKLHAKSRKK